MTPTLSKTDFNALRELIVKQPNNSGKSLGEAITKDLVAEEKDVHKQTVSLNSFVEIKDVTSNKNMRMQIVLPDFVDVKERRISVFAPISVALMGFKETDTINWKTPTGEASFQITKVINDWSGF